MKGKCAVHIIATCLLAAVSATAAGQTLDAALATVRLHKTANISRNEYLSRLKLVEEQTGIELTDALKTQLLDAMIDAELMLQDAEEMSIRVREQDIDTSLERQRLLLSQQSGRQISERQFRELIEQQTGLKWSEYREQVRERLLQEQYVVRVKRELFASIEEPSDEAVQAFYEENATRYTNPAITHTEFLLFQTDNISEAQAKARQQKANEILKIIGDSDEEFERYKQLSLNDASFSTNEALLLRDNRQQAELYGAAFMKEVFGLEEDMIAQKVIESRLGHHVIRIIEKRNPKVLLLSDPILPGQSITVKDQIQNQLLAQKQQEVLQTAIQEVITELRSRANVRTFSDRL